MTHDVRISAEGIYQASHSEPIQNKFLFAYTIHIENRSKYTLQLLRRHWYIIDSIHGLSEVEGEGVVGQKPILNPGDGYQYSSWCPLNSEIGRMEGYFTFANLHTQELIQVRVPAFQLISDTKLN